MRYMIIVKAVFNVKSRVEAVEWTRKFPNPTLDGSDCEIGLSGAEKEKRP